MLNTNERIIKHKVGLLNLAEELGNVSKACQVMGLSRDTFYRYKSAVEEGGVEALLKVVANPPALDANTDSDGDGLDDAAEGAGDADSDRIPDYLDDVPNSNMLRIDADGRMLETETGLALRLGANVFAGGGRYAGINEASIDEDPGYGFPSGAVDFEITGLVPDSKAIVVVPLKLPIPDDAVYRKYVNSRWLDFVVDDDNAVASAPGAGGACPPPGSNAYVDGLVAGFGCVQLTVRDGGPNDADWLANGIIHDPGGLAVPVGVTLEALSVPDSRIKGAGSALLMHLRLHCDSGDIELSALTLDASGSGNDHQIKAVQVLVDLDRDGVVDPDDPEIGTGRYDTDDGHLQLTMQTPYEIPAGGSDLLVIYDFPR